MYQREPSRKGCESALNQQKSGISISRQIRIKGLQGDIVKTMPFNLQSNIPDRALPDALQTLLVQQTEALEALLHYAQGTMEAIRAHRDMSSQEQTTRVDALAQVIAAQLIVLEDQKSQMQVQMEEFQRLLRQQGNPILAHTVERVKEVLEQNLAVARQHLSAIIHGQSSE
jgi:DNA-binding FadR family transcriptional regulator